MKFCRYAAIIAANSSSLPVRGAWIEMVGAAGKGMILDVAPRAGSVD